MPDGRTHDEITLVTASFITPISAGLIFDGQPGRAALLVASFLVSGLLFSDDLDTHSIEYKRWRLLRFLWLPYQKLLPHRSWLSHGLIIGPALRIAYFAAVLTLFAWLALAALARMLPLDASGLMGEALAAIGRWIVDHPHAVVTAFGGFAAGGAVHSLSDSIWTWWRRTWRVPAGATVATDGYAPTHHGQPLSAFGVRVSENVSLQD